MITLNINLVLIFKVLMRILQVLGSLYVIAVAFSLVMFTEITLTAEMLDFMRAGKFILVIGSMLMFSEWVVMLLGAKNMFDS
jgi:hypothetical protein